METEPLKELPASKPGDRVLRRLRRPRRKLRNACQNIAKCFRILGKH